MRSVQQLVAIAITCLASFPTMAASVLPLFEPRTVEPGDLFEQIVDWNRDSGARMEISLVAAPDGAGLVVTDDGQLLVRWQTDTNLADESALIFQARDIDSQTIADTRVLVVRNGSTLPPDESYSDDGFDNSTEASDNSEPLIAPPVSDAGLRSGEPAEEDLAITRNTSGIDDTVPENPWLEADAPLSAVALAPRENSSSATATRRAVVLNALAGQIVSAGRTVSLRFNGSTTDGAEPLIRIDRLPRNASFEKNARGDYTLFWQTSNRDQGEHVFRLTATHPEDESISTSRDLTIVVGDPSRSRTVPADDPGFPPR